MLVFQLGAFGETAPGNKTASATIHAEADAAFAAAYFFSHVCFYAPVIFEIRERHASDGTRQRKTQHTGNDFARPEEGAEQSQRHPGKGVFEVLPGGEQMRAHQVINRLADGLVLLASGVVQPDAFLNAGETCCLLAFCHGQFIKGIVRGIFQRDAVFARPGCMETFPRQEEAGHGLLVAVDENTPAGAAPVRARMLQPISRTGAVSVGLLDAVCPHAAEYQPGGDGKGAGEMPRQTPEQQAGKATCQQGNAAVLPPVRFCRGGLPVLGNHVNHQLSLSG